MADSEGFVPFALPDITEAEIDAVVGAMRSRWLTTGPNAAAFEEEFAAYLGGEGLHAVAVNSATAGLHLAVEALGLGPGDEVLVPTWTFTATAEVVRYVGASPVFVDIDRATLNIDLTAAAALVTANTKAIIPVHFAGLPVGRDELGTFASRHGVRVIEDAAHAFPVREGSRFVGDSDSAAVVFSFYATKTIATGEGGMLVTRDTAIAQRARTMRLHGISRDVFDRYTSKKPSWEYAVVAPGFKYNMPDTAAAMGRVQLVRAEQMRRRRQVIADRYDAAFSHLPAELPARAGDDIGHAHHLYVIRLADDAPLSRNQFIEELGVLGVGASVHFIPLHRHAYWRETYGLNDAAYPVATSAFDRVVSLPIFSAMSDSEIERVVTVVAEVLSRSRNHFPSVTPRGLASGGH